MFILFILKKKNESTPPPPPGVHADMRQVDFILTRYPRGKLLVEQKLAKIDQ